MHRLSPYPPTRSDAQTLPVPSDVEQCGGEPYPVITHEANEVGEGIVDACSRHRNCDLQGIARYIVEVYIVLRVGRDGLVVLTQERIQSSLDLAVVLDKAEERGVFNPSIRRASALVELYI